MTDKKYNGKYEKLPAWKRFLHKNTGFIVMGIIGAIILTAWTINEQEMEFFHSWNCEKILYYMMSVENYGYPDHNDLSQEQHLKLHQLYADDCSNDKFQAPDTLEVDHGFKDVP